MPTKPGRNLTVFQEWGQIFVFVSNKTDTVREKNNKGDSRPVSTCTVNKIARGTMYVCSHIYTYAYFYSKMLYNNITEVVS